MSAFSIESKDGQTIIYLDKNASTIDISGNLKNTTSKNPENMDGTKNTYDKFLQISAGKNSFALRASLDNWYILTQMFIDELPASFKKGLIEYLGGLPLDCENEMDEEEAYIDE